MVKWTGNIAQGPRSNLAVQGRGLEFVVSEQHLDHADVHLLFKQVRRETMATGIITLLMNRSSIESTTGIIPTTTSP